jgi:IS5 family transposase
MGAAREHAKDPPGEPAGPKSLLLVASKEKAAHEKGVERVCIPNRSAKSADRKKEQKKRWFRNGQKWRTGCEGRISEVKRRPGLNRCRYKGDDGMHRWVGLGVIGDNLINIRRNQAWGPPQLPFV